MLRGARVRIGLELQRPVGADDLVFVERARREAGREQLPDAAFAPKPHRPAPSIPLVERTDDADAARIGRPDGEGDAGDAVMLDGVGAERLPAFAMRSFRQEIDVELAQHGREAVDVVELAGAALALGAQAVAKRLAPAGNGAGEEAVGMDPLQFRHGFAVRRIDHRDLARPGKEGADDDRAVFPMHPEQ